MQRRFPMKPEIRLALGFSSSMSMFIIPSWASLTTTSVVPASSAPSTAAFTSPVSSRRNRS